MAADPPARRFLPTTVVALGLTSFFTDISSEMIFPLLPLFLAETLGAGAAFLGLIEGIADAVASLLKLWAGRLSDRMHRRKPLVLAGYALAGLVRPLVAVAVAPWQVLAIRVTDRVGKGIRGAPRDAMVADAALPGQAGRAFGFQRGMDHAGAVAGALLAAMLLAAGLAVRSVFWLAAIPAVFATITIAVMREQRREPAGGTNAATATARSPAVATPALAAPAAATSAATSAAVAIGATRRDQAPGARLSSSFRLYLAILALFALGNSSDAFLLLRARDLGLAASLLPLLWVALHLSKLVFSYLGGELSDRLRRVHLIVAGWAVYALAYLGLGLAQRPWHAWALFLLYGLYYGLTEPVEKALVRDIVPVELRGRAFGAYHFVVGAAALPAGLLTGTLWSLFGPGLALTVGASLAALASVLLLVWGFSQHRRD